jgi:hypothetical protein
MQRFLGPRRLRVAGVIVVAIAAVVSVAAIGGAASSSAAESEPLCVQHPALCAESNNAWSYEGTTYTSGHDEPSLLFYSNQAGSGNSSEYHLTLPSDPPAPPTAGGGGTTWNFQLRPAFWFGMAMCDDQSAPNPGVTCPPDSDSNIHTGTDPTKPDYIGNTPGSAFMEMQFYPPGWGPISCTDAHGRQDGKWCSAMTIDSFPVNQNTGIPNNTACQASQGPEPVNWAAITKSGVPAAPANPFTPFSSQAVVTADTLEYNNGDQLVVDMHDTAAGFQVSITDQTTGQSGLMTASTANGFGHALYEPNANSCTFQPYAFHPMYSTSSPSTRVLWAAHSYNVAFSDEIGHFENCTKIDSSFNCNPGHGDKEPKGPNPGDNQGCFPAPIVSPTGTTLENNFIGCLASDNDFDGVPYTAGAWPGNPGAVAGGNVPTPVEFSSPLFTLQGQTALSDYQQVAFEADLPRIEGADFSNNNNCQRHVSNPADPSPGAGCVNPPNGASFYPMYTTTTDSNGACIWREGGNFGTTQFGGNSAAEFGGLLLSNYPAAGFKISQRFNNFRNVLDTNPCPTGAG